NQSCSGNGFTQTDTVAQRNMAIVFTPENQCALSYQMSFTRNAVRVPATDGAQHCAMRGGRGQQMMARRKFLLIQGPAAAAIGIFHALAQDPTRSQKERRDYVTHQRQLRDAWQ